MLLFRNYLYGFLFPSSLVCVNIVFDNHQNWSCIVGLTTLFFAFLFTRFDNRNTSCHLIAKYSSSGEIPDKIQVFGSNIDKHVKKPNEGANRPPLLAFFRKGSPHCHTSSRPRPRRMRFRRRSHLCAWAWIWSHSCEPNGCRPPCVQVHNNTVTVVASDNDGNTDSDTDEAVVSFDNVDPTIVVGKVIKSIGDTYEYTVLQNEQWEEFVRVGCSKAS